MAQFRLDGSNPQATRGDGTAAEIGIHSCDHCIRSSGDAIHSLAKLRWAMKPQTTLVEQALALDGSKRGLWFMRHSVEM